MGSYEAAEMMHITFLNTTRFSTFFEENLIRLLSIVIVSKNKLTNTAMERPSQSLLSLEGLRFLAVAMFF
jgi:hypothetical protein